MKFYYVGKIDAQGRFCLGSLVKPGDKVYCYCQDEKLDRLYIAPYSDDMKGIPTEVVRCVEDKCRIILPKWFRRDAKEAMVGTDDGGVIVVSIISRNS